MCQKESQKRMVLEGEEGNLEKVAVENLEKEKEQTDKNAKNTVQMKNMTGERFETRIY